MTHVAIDYGRQLVRRDGAEYFAHVVVLSCGCKVEIDPRMFVIHGKARAQEACDAMLRCHTCDHARGLLEGR